MNRNACKGVDVAGVIDGLGKDVVSITVLKRCFVREIRTMISENERNGNEDASTLGTGYCRLARRSLMDGVQVAVQIPNSPLRFLSSKRRRFALDRDACVSRVAVEFFVRRAAPPLKSYSLVSVLHRGYGRRVTVVAVEQ